MDKEKYIAKLFRDIDETLMAEARVRSKLRKLVLELRKLICIK